MRLAATDAHELGLELRVPGRELASPASIVAANSRRLARVSLCFRARVPGTHRGAALFWILRGHEEIVRRDSDIRYRSSETIARTHSLPYGSFTTALSPRPSSRAYTPSANDAF